MIISSWPALTADDARLGAVLVRALPMAAQRESRVAADDKPTAVVKAGGWQPRAEVLGGILALAAEDGTLRRSRRRPQRLHGWRRTDRQRTR